MELDNGIMFNQNKDEVYQSLLFLRTIDYEKLSIAELLQKMNDFLDGIYELRLKTLLSKTIQQIVSIKSTEIVLRSEVPNFSLNNAINSKLDAILELLVNNEIGYATPFNEFIKSVVDYFEENGVKIILSGDLVYNNRFLSVQNAVLLLNLLNGLILNYEFVGGTQTIEIVVFDNKSILIILDSETNMRLHKQDIQHLFDYKGALKGVSALGGEVAMQPTFSRNRFNMSFAIEGIIDIEYPNILIG